MLRKILLFSLVLAAIHSLSAKHLDTEDFEEWQEFKEFQRWKEWKRSQEDKPRSWRTERRDKFKYRPESRLSSLEDTSAQDPPPIDEAARMARYIVNQNNWTSVATISIIDNVRSFPFVNVVSYSDGQYLNGTGMPYLYITPLDYTAQDLSKDNRATLSMSLAEGEYCAKQSYDPMDPRCARVYLTGIIKPVKNTTDEFDIAKNAVFGRHPWLAHMPADHHFFFAKMKIIQIALLDTFGGPKYITPKDYFATNQLPSLPMQRNPEAYSDDSSNETTGPKVLQV